MNKNKKTLSRKKIAYVLIFIVVLSVIGSLIYINQTLTPKIEVVIQKDVCRVANDAAVENMTMVDVKNNLYKGNWFLSVAYLYNGKNINSLTTAFLGLYTLTSVEMSGTKNKITFNKLDVNSEFDTFTVENVYDIVNPTNDISVVFSKRGSGAIRRILEYDLQTRSYSSKYKNYRIGDDLQVISLRPTTCTSLM